jgi:hypothetical protein
MRGARARLVPTIHAVSLAFVLLVALLSVVGALVPPTPQELVHPAISPGHEAQVSTLVAPALERGFLGHRVQSIQIEGSQVRLPLQPDPAATADCHLPAWAKPSGGLWLVHEPAEPVPERLDADGKSGVVRDASGLALGWALCEGAPRAREEAMSLLGQIAARHHLDIWGVVARAPMAPRDQGLLSPVIPAGRDGSFVLALALAVGLALTGAAALLPSRDPESAPSPDSAPLQVHRGVILLLVGLVVLGAALRIAKGVSLPLDGDERWALPSGRPVLDDDHDAWIHPPVFRALQAAWTHGIHWHPGDALWLLRAPSIAASVLTLALVAATLAAARTPVWAAAWLGFLALSPRVATASVLARPYAISAALVAITAVGLWAEPGSRRCRPGLGWMVAVAAAGLAAWTDLVAGLVAGALVATALVDSLLHDDHRSRVRRALVALTFVAWAAPLVPGALSAARHQVHPTTQIRRHEGGDPRDRAAEDGHPDLRPERGMGHGSTPGFVNESMGFAATGGLPLGGLVGVSLAALLAWGAWRRERSTRGAALLVALVCLVAVSTRVGMRDRNLLFLPALVALVVGWELPRAARELGRRRPAARR